MGTGVGVWATRLVRFEPRRLPDTARVFLAAGASSSEQPYRADLAEK